jgi:hypothetical protein
MTVWTVTVCVGVVGCLLAAAGGYYILDHHRRSRKKLARHHTSQSNTNSSPQRQSSNDKAQTTNTNSSRGPATNDDDLNNRPTASSEQLANPKQTANSSTNISPVKKYGLADDDDDVDTDTANSDDDDLNISRQSMGSSASASGSKTTPMTAAAMHMHSPSRTSYGTYLHTQPRQLSRAKLLRIIDAYSHDDGNTHHTSSRDNGRASLSPPSVFVNFDDRLPSSDGADLNSPTLFPIMEEDEGQQFDFDNDEDGEDTVDMNNQDEDDDDVDEIIIGDDMDQHTPNTPNNHTSSAHTEQPHKWKSSSFPALFGRANTRSTSNNTNNSSTSNASRMPSVSPVLESVNANPNSPQKLMEAMQAKLYGIAQQVKIKNFFLRLCQAPFRGHCMWAVRVCLRGCVRQWVHVDFVLVPACIGLCSCVCVDSRMTATTSCCCKTSRS